jgi:hypothetical protein
MVPLPRDLENLTHLPRPGCARPVQARQKLALSGDPSPALDDMLLRLSEVAQLHSLYWLIITCL